MARLHHVAKSRGTTKTSDGCRTCGKCDAKINVGDSYFHWSNRLPGSRSGTLNVRCALHRPSPAEMTPGRRGQLLAIQESVEQQLEQCGDTADDYASIGESAAEELRELADGLRESGEAIEEGFGHATSQSDELVERADTIDQQCDELEYVTIDDAPQRDDFTGDDEDDEDDDGEDEFESALADWRTDAADAILDVLLEVDLG